MKKPEGDDPLAPVARHFFEVRIESDAATIAALWRRAGDLIPARPAYCMFIKGEVPQR